MADGILQVVDFACLFAPGTLLIWAWAALERSDVPASWAIRCTIVSETFVGLYTVVGLVWSAAFGPDYSMRRSIVMTTLFLLSAAAICFAGSAKKHPAKLPLVVSACAQSVFWIITIAANSVV